MRRFTEKLKRDLLDRLKLELNKCWDMYGNKDSVYYDLERALETGYGIVCGFDYAVEAFREGRFFTANDNEYLEEKLKIWQRYRAKYYSAKGMRDPFVKPDYVRNKI